MPDGATYRDHLLSVERAGQSTGELDAPPLPAGCEELLGAFWQLRQGAGDNGMTPNAIRPSEVVAWQQLHGVQLMPDEVDLLFAMDSAAMAAFADNAAKTAKYTRGAKP